VPPQFTAVVPGISFTPWHRASAAEAGLQLGEGVLLALVARGAAVGEVATEEVADGASGDTDVDAPNG
jgi:hypothetical protein